MVAPPPLNDLREHHRRIAPEIERALAEVLASGELILGARVRVFEAELAALAGARHGIGVGSGTDALRIALLAFGIGPGDEVITVANAGVPPVAAIDSVGARPVLVDVQPHSRNLDPERLPAALTQRTRAILVVHLYGHPAELDPIVAFARAHGLKVLEDCAQAHGARYRGRPVGSFGDAAAFSFYPTKNLGALGDAGLMVTSDDELADRARLQRNHGWRRQHVSELRAGHSRLDELQAAVLSAQLPQLAGWNLRRRELAARYSAQLEGVVTLPSVAAHLEDVHHLYVVESPSRDALAAHLSALGIGTGIHYPVPVHLQPAYRALDASALPVTERLAQSVLSLPMYAELEDAQVDLVAAAVRALAPTPKME